MEVPSPLLVVVPLALLLEAEWSLPSPSENMLPDRLMGSEILSALFACCLYEGERLWEDLSGPDLLQTTMEPSTSFTMGIILSHPGAWEE